MAVKATAIFVFFDIALLSLVTTKTLATFADPNSIFACRILVPGHNNFAKCYAEYKATYGLAATIEFGKAVAATSREKKLVATALDKGNDVVYFVLSNEPNKDQSKEASSCREGWITATRRLLNALYVMQGEIALSQELLLESRKNLNFAEEQQGVNSCIVGYSPKGVILNDLEAVILEAKRDFKNALNAHKEILGYKPA